MKKFPTLLILLFSVFAFSQNDVGQKIQNYLDVNYSTYRLTFNDVQNWTIESTATSKATKITNYYIKQQYQGIDIFRAVTNVSYKEGAVINLGNRFLANVDDKINTTSASLGVTEAFAIALNATGYDAFTTSVLEKKDATNYLLSNGSLTDEPVQAELVFANLNDGQTLKLAWDYTFFAQDHKHYWSIRVDAVNGDVLQKEDWTISCDFGDHTDTTVADILNAQAKQNVFSFEETAAVENNSYMFSPPSAAYNVLPFYIESPKHGSRQLLTNPEDLTASPYGWHDINGVDGAEFTITRGNNVLAQDDPDGDDGTGYSPDAGATLVFDYAYPGTGVQASDYVDAAVTNLFYMNNIVHDITYHYGFDEPNGNFQKSNYGNGGVFTFTGDFVNADAQDGGGTNNANFSTPTDGNSPRMQMYLWTYGPSPKYLTINSPASIAGDIVSLDNSFDPGHVDLPLAPNGLTADLVLFDDGVGPDTSDACDAATAANAAALNGNIAVIRRGDCTFISKVAAAQNAGAIAVIMVNNVSFAVDGENDYVNMSGADASVNIPAIFVSKADGEAIIAAMSNGSVTVNGTLSEPSEVFIASDGDFDNLVITHEYGHGVSTRLTGGLGNSSCLFNAEQMGEGWSDWLGYMLQIEAGDTGTDHRGIATFLAGQETNGVGIREYPYSTDLSVDPLTFGDTNNYTYVSNGTTYVDSHSVGTVWASMLWDLTWAYIEKYGFDPDIYNGTGGNNKVFQLVLDAMKLQPCSPGFVDGRDAIIAADQATTGGEDYCLIWEVFARRGLGIHASSGSTDSITDQTEDFAEPAAGSNCTFLKTESFNLGTNVSIYPNPSTGIFNIEIADFTGDVEVTVFDTNGRIVYEDIKTNFSAQTQINLSNVDRGMYIIQLKADGVQYVNKLMKN